LIDRDAHRVAEHLGALGYLHLDYWLRCGRCGYSPCFGQELSDPHPIYWFPTILPHDQRVRIETALHHHINPGVCICGNMLELHKVWVNTWRLDDSVASGVSIEEDHTDALMFRTKPKGGANIPSGILAQWKCVDPHCKYVRFITL
jgi:hypothetical protein